MTTPLQLIKQAYRDAGVLGIGETLQAEDVNDALRKLNWMMDEWAQQRWLVYHLVEKSLLCTGAVSYTVGPGGDIDMTPRPNSLNSAVIQISNPSGQQTTYPMDILQAYEDYQRIGLKTLVGPGRVVFLDTAWPLGNLYVWPVPQASLYTLKLLFKVSLTNITSLTTDINLPPAYESAMHWNLAMRLLPAAGDTQPNPVLILNAKNSLRVLRLSNAQVRRLSMPQGIPRRGYFDAAAGIWR